MENSATFTHPPVLRNEKLNEQFFRNGYAHFPFLNQSEVAALRNLFYQYHQPDEVSGLYVSSQRKDRKVMDAINEKNSEIFAKPIAQHCIFRSTPLTSGKHADSLSESRRGPYIRPMR